MQEKYTWNLRDIFETKDDFENEIKKLNSFLEKVKTYQGKLADSSKNIFECYENYEKALECNIKIYAYGMLKFHLNMSNGENNKLFKECEALDAKVDKETSFITPEITNMDTDVLLKYIEENDNLKRYERLLKEIIKNKAHILSKEGENILANYSEVFNGSKSAYEVLTNAEFKFGDIELENGEKKELTDSNYSIFMKNKNEKVRKQAFEKYREKYKEFSNTLAEMYLCKVKEDIITARLRKYNSSLEKAVFEDDSNLKVYNSLVKATHQNLDANHEFTKLKKQLLKKDELHLYDLFLNPFETKDDDISFEEARKQVLEALSVFGEEYTKKIEFAFDNGWLDLYPAPNKYGGAYNMGVYGVHPYVLSNYIKQKRDVSTIAHEFGHAMHSYLASSNQNIFDASYKIMVAEIASTTNEIILAKYQMEKEKDPIKKAEIIYELMDMIRSTLFTQTMFAEFEKEVHGKIEEGCQLSTEEISSIYYNLKKEYTGSDMIIDDLSRYEWLYIPHFYTPFYVYKYATGVSSAIIIANNILNKKESYVDRYLNMLKQGCKKNSIDLLKMVDVDLEKEETYEIAFNYFKDKLEELKKLI